MAFRTGMGVLGEAATRNLIKLTHVIDRLRRTTVRCAPALFKTTIERYGTNSQPWKLLDWLKQPVDLEPMRKIQASEAKTHLPQLLDEVERGETLVITRHGRVIARIVPEEGRRQQEVELGLQEIAEVRRRTGPVTVKELLSARDEGRRA